MEIEIGREARKADAYGFDDVAIVPSRRTETLMTLTSAGRLGPYRFDPLVASAMDGVVSPETNGKVHKLGGLGVLNPKASGPGSKRRREAGRDHPGSKDKATALMQRSTRLRSRRS